MKYTNEYLKEVLSRRYDDLSSQSLKRIEELEAEVKELKSILRDLELEMKSEHLRFPDYAKKVLSWDK